MKYIPTIGIETHVQLKTKTKLFSAVGNDASQAKPNSLISHIDVGMPGALPVLNEAAIELACRAAFALYTKPQKFSKFDRKHYFYPDLPKGYQITQYEDPIIKGGHVDLESDGQKSKVGITRVHLEEDAGKNTHPAGADYSLVDLNRAGTPLLEIVSEPEIHSAEQAKAYVRELYLLMKYANVSDCDLYLGHMRFDVNVSLSAHPSALGTRAEVKNLNSFRSVEGAVAYEIKRQTELLERGEKVVQETRGWDEAKQKTASQRGKEEAEDYRYMPEPDIPPVELTDQQIEEFKKTVPKLPPEIREILNKLSIGAKVVEDILDSEAICEKVLNAIDHKLDIQVVRRIAYDSLEQPETVKIPLESHAKIASSYVSHDLSSTTYSHSINVLKDDPFYNDVEGLIKKNAQVSDESIIDKIVVEVITENPKASQDVKNGEAKAIGFLVGQVMAKSKGQANPGLAQQIIKKQLGAK